MLSITKELVMSYEKLEFHERNLRLELIARHGGIVDAQELLSLYLKDAKRDELLFPIRKLGDVNIGSELYRHWFDGRSEPSSDHTELCHSIGYLGCQEALPRLWEKAAKGDYWDSMGSVLGLIHLDCDSIQKEIANEIRRLRGQSLFNEFVPLLAYKTGDESLIEELFQWGNGNAYGCRASTDCNGGLITGIALFGDKGRSRFEQLLWNPYWEATGAGTGSALWSYDGVRLLQYKFEDLLHQIRTHLNVGVDKGQIKYEVTVLLELIEVHIGISEETRFKFTPPARDSWGELRKLCDSDLENQGKKATWWGDSLHDFVAEQFDLHGDLMRIVHRLLGLLELRSEQEEERKFLKGWNSEPK